MRRRARTDRNHAEVRDALRDIPGVSVTDLAALGDGKPDLLVGIGDAVNELMEVKDGTKPPSKRKLTPAQIDFHGAWRGRPPVVVTSAAQAVAHVVAVLDALRRR